MHLNAGPKQDNSSLSASTYFLSIASPRLLTFPLPIFYPLATPPLLLPIFAMFWLIR